MVVCQNAGLLVSVNALAGYGSYHGLAVPVIAALRGGLTGSPAGAGDEDGVYLRAGDVVEVSLADLPALTTTIAAPSELDPSPTQECR